MNDHRSTAAEDLLSETDSRAASDALLTLLKEGGWSPRTWTRFLLQAAHRSVHQARLRPRALYELTILHVVFGSAGRRPGWPAASWLLAVSHLGLLEHRGSLSAADIVTLTRANLPALVPRAPPWLGVTALGSDLVDGELARAMATETPFGRYADSFADAAFWSWYAFHQGDRRLRWLALAAWVVPVVAVTATSTRRGRMVEAPRPRVLRPAAALQVLLTLRAFRRQDTERATRSAL